MTSVCIYFEVHQPMRLNRFSVFNIGKENDGFSTYFNHELNQWTFEKVAKKCYLPTNNLLLDLIDLSCNLRTIFFTINDRGIIFIY